MPRNPDAMAENQFSFMMKGHASAITDRGENLVEMVLVVDPLITCCVSIAVPKTGLHDTQLILSASRWHKSGLVP